ncbi:class I adenylate-forming enzyme family protein [Nocardia tengchongensis]|uniref:class I adenylate-forming enzyme family protein n=1 Tax=Nocardia tengchongensis TaxID=2055889 RepID=UPI003619C8C0
MNLSELPDRRAATAPDAPALADDRVALDNTGFLAAVQRAASMLGEVGVGTGDVVAVMLPNTADLVVALFAAWRLGAAATPVNPALTAEEIDFQVADAGAKVLVTDRAFTGSVGTVVSVERLRAGGLEPAAPPAATPTDALALLIYTSGTTGRPKGVMLDHTNLLAMSGMVIDALELTAADHSLLILPLFHVNGIVVSVLSPLLAGGRTTVAGRFDTAGFFDRIESSRPTYFSAVPTIYTMLAGLPARVRPDTSSIRFAICGAAPASAELLAGFEARYGIPIIEGYGLSECTCACTINPLAGPRKPGTVGLPLPGQRIRVLTADGYDAAPGEIGEVLVSGPNIMRGYLNRPLATAATVMDGWLYTGDIGQLDADGYLTLVDRAKDMIIRGGENIYPKEIETVVYRLPGIAEAAVVGRPDPVYGEQPILFVALTAGATLDATAIREHARTGLAKFKLPVSIRVLDELPKNAVGKIDKPALRRLDARTH